MNILAAKQELHALVNSNYAERVVFSTAVEYGLATWIAAMQDFEFTCTAGNSDGTKCVGLWFDNGRDLEERQNQYVLDFDMKRTPEHWYCHRAHVREVVFTEDGFPPDDTFELTIE